MYCTRCGTINEAGSKYCRECGSQLGIEQQEVELVGESQAGQPDDAAVAEVLYEALKLYEHGALDLAFVKAREALSINPNSASAHSLLGLIYEKRAEERAAGGNLEDAQDYLQSAIRQVEQVLEANPESVADRGKLEGLRARLAELQGVPAKRSNPLWERVAAAARRIPAPMAASAVVFIVVFLVLVLVLHARGRGRRPESETAGRQPRQTAQQPAPGLPPAAGTQPSLPAWTYQPQPPASSLPPQVYSAAPDNTYQQPGATERVPGSAAPVPAVPYPAEPGAPRKPGRAQEVMVPPAPKPDARPADLARAALAKGDYESAAGSYEDAIMQGEDTAENHQQLAICLDSLGRKSAAVSHLQRALQLYTERKSKGRDVAAAEAGIKACQDHLALLRD